MAFVPCLICGTKIPYPGAHHTCKGAAKSSDGGGEQTRYSVKEGVPYSKTQANALPSKRSYRSKGEEAPSGPRVESRIGTAGVASGPSEANLVSQRGNVPDNKQALTRNRGTSEVKKGRPRIGEDRPKPWLTADPPMSERTWYRRQKEAKK